MTKPPIRPRALQLWWMLIAVAVTASTVLAVVKIRSVSASERLVDIATPIVTISKEDLREIGVTFQGKGLPADLDIRVMRDDGQSSAIKAKTGRDGKLPVDFVSWDQFRPESAFAGNRLSLPMNSYGTVGIERIEDIEVLRGPGGRVDDMLKSQSGVGGVVDILTRRPFAVHQGRFVDPSQYALNLVSPFSLLCRSDEGPPVTLTDGDRFAFDVPGGETGLKRVLDQRFVINPHVYRLPDGMGHSVSSAAGPAPKETWNALQGLERAGSIARLEVDPCWEFLPNGRAADAGCVPGVRDFPDKAIRLSDSFGSTLRSSYQQGAVSDAWVWYGPLSPTPFYNPGDRAGDDRPPTFVRTGADGAYRAMLNGLSGPIEIGVAKGCNEHTTVAISEGPGTQTGSVAGLTTSRTPPGGAGTSTAGTLAGPISVPPAKPTASTPGEKPDPNQKICGPDVTDYVVGVLQLMEDSYKSWKSDERERRCNVLFHPLKFNAAWDMQYFAPSDGGEGTKPGDAGWMDYIFFQRAAPGYCAIPRWPCGPTVQFFGYCVNAQVANYVQWGMMNYLCDSEIAGDAAVLVRSAFSPNLTGQDAMRQIGTTFGRVGGDPGFRKDVMKRRLDGIIAENRSGWNKMEGTDCALICDKIAPQAKAWLDNNAWGFQWGSGDTDGIPITERGTKLKKP